MNMKKCMGFCLKVIISGVLALVILSLLCLYYYNPPIAEPQPEGYTNFKFVPNSSWSFMTEGNGHGVVNSLGYNGVQDPIDGKKKICFLGSSQTEALQVDTEQNFVSLFESMLDSEDYQCLNLGISGHSFDIIASNFRNFADSFQDVSHVVIELSNVEFSDEQLEKMLNEEYHSDLEQHSSLYQLMQRIPYMRLLA